MPCRDGVLHALAALAAFEGPAARCMLIRVLQQEAAVQYLMVSFLLSDALSMSISFFFFFSSVYGSLPVAIGTGTGTRDHRRPTPLRESLLWVQYVPFSYRCKLSRRPADNQEEWWRASSSRSIV